ncbi:ribose-phosphate diphosphokinase [Acidiphilium cryptum]|uniref:ribose-phosphate diphosphokinase n=1 Tax=Acidiphilium cryptum (strain JF-5) TaxID=349163 RepID=A5G077_ACICJ|nr:ribose-phosphate diphosphokinase [Acidiphilium cryptum]ABQ31259.1 ribose-phosphate pyrophosphokinase [Acidiphilium cryptum JF-5]
MTRAPLSLFGLHGSRPLAEQVAARLEIALAAHEERDFEDGEHKARPLQDVRGHDAFVLHTLHGGEGDSANDRLCRLLFFCGALRDAGAARVTAVAPYLCYARKDRRTKTNDPVTTRYVAAMFEAVGIGQVITLEVHNLAAFENAFRCPSLHVPAAPLFAAHFAPLLRRVPAVVVSPDTGGAKRAEQVREALESLRGAPVSAAFMEKHRSGGVVTGTLFAGDVRGRVAIIVDDLISTGGTLLRAARACREAGAAEIHAAAAHGLFTGGAEDLFAAGLFESIVVSSTVPPFRLAGAARARLTVLDAAEPLARAIAACHDAG